jgi:transcription elongation factor GreA
MQGSIPFTQESYDKLVAELDKLKKEDRPKVIEEIAEARAQGDLKENAEYHAAKDKQGEIEDRIRVLEDKIARAQVLNIDTANAEHILFGATVTVKNLKTKKNMKYTLVSSDAVDVLEGKISSESPIGKALIGKKRGEKVVAKTPRGDLEFEVVDYE